MKVRALAVLALLPFLGVSVIAQTTVAPSTCSATSYTNALICTLPQLFGPQGLTLPNPNHSAHFAASSDAEFLPLNQGIGQALAILPLGSSGSGTTFTLDAQGHPKATEDSLGPILTERANVIGKKAVSLGVAYQYINFTHIDGIRLSSFPAVLTHSGWSSSLPVDPGPANPQAGIFQQDYVTTSNEVHIDLNQTVVYAVVGLTNRIDASVEVPIQAAHLRVVSIANIVRTQTCEFNQDCNVLFNGHNTAVCGEFHWFNFPATNSPGNCQNIYSSLGPAIYPYPGSPGLIGFGPSATPTPLRTAPPMEDANGVGDITLRGKYEVIRGEKVVGSVGMGVRFPSGDANNFLGTGAYGVIPFGAITYRARFSPHARFGYEWNSHSVLAGDPIPNVFNEAGHLPPSASLPPAWLYSAGADYRATKWLTFGADLIGERVRDAQRLYLSSYSLLPQITSSTAPTAANEISVPSIRATPDPASAPSTRTLESYNSDSIAVGGKARLFHQLVLVGNASIRVDEGGLRANVVPLVGLSYAF